MWQLFWTFFKIGAFTFGSGYAMIPMIEKEVIDRKRWFSREEFSDHFALAQSAPGPIALNTAVFVGYRQKGWTGSAVSLLGAVLPSFIILLAVAVWFPDIRDNGTVAAAFKGIRPAVVALIAVPFVRMMLPLGRAAIPLCIAAALVIWQSGISPVWLIAAAGIAGILRVLLQNRPK